MIQFTFAFLIGVLLLQNQPQLPDAGFTGLLPLIVWLLWRYRTHPWLVAPSALLCGFFWAALMAHLAMERPLPVDLEGVDLSVTGFVDSIPEVNGDRARFKFHVETMSAEKAVVRPPVSLLLSWYRDAPMINAGDRWQLRVRLKRPHGMSNPGSLDYERILFSRGIDATGYVRSSAENHAVGVADGFVLIDRLRQYIGRRIDPLLGEEAGRGILRALIIGDRSLIGPQQWELFRRTGTNHLVAISGLHIGIVSGLFLLLGSSIWRSLPGLCLLLPAQQAGAVFAIVAGFGYAALAGFAIPCVRALVMLCVVLGGFLLRRPVLPARSLSIALLLVVIVDPFSVLLPGFWLSFGAVTVIILGTSGRFGSSQRLLWMLLRIQLVVALGLAPLLLLFGFDVSLVSPLVNMLAVPLFSFLLVPLALTGALFLFLLPPVGGWLLTVAAWLIHQFYVLLTVATDSFGPMISLGGSPAPWLLVGVLVAVILLLLPAGVPGRWSGLVLLLPLLLHQPPVPPTGAAWVSVLDVGQGLAVVVRTASHVLLYDSGPRFPSGFDTGDSVVLPYLRTLAVQRVDRIIVSNGDLDHRGGLASVLREFPAARVMSGEPERIVATEAAFCHSGETWEWDGVYFQIIHPDHPAEWRGNNASCVLSVRSAGGARLLLSGDIESAVEEELVRKKAEKLRADVVTVPHHGSATSSGEDFISASGARYALVSAGYRNRYGFPRPEVTARWLSRDTRIINTAESGAITLQLATDGSLIGPVTHRQQVRRYWMDRK